MRRAVLAAVLVAAHASGAAAQGTCHPPADSHEAQLFAALAVPLVYATLAAPAPLASGAVQVALEGTCIPNIDAETRTPTIKGPEQTDLLSAFPRPRV
jgi:hypothetical protein